MRWENDGGEDLYRRFIMFIIISSSSGIIMLTGCKEAKLFNYFLSCRVFF